MKKIIVIILALVLIGTMSFLIFKDNLDETQVSYTTNSRSPFCTEKYMKNIISVGEKYINNSLKFSITVPVGWSMPISEDYDPHFGNCKTDDGFEIQSSQSPSELFASEYSEYLKPTKTRTIKINNELVTDAIVREYQDIDPGGDPWPYSNVILFPAQKVAYYFLSQKSIESYQFISSFALLR